MNRRLFALIFFTSICQAVVCQVGSSPVSGDEFTVEVQALGVAQSCENDKRRYTQVRDDLIELLGEVMELTVVHIERLADLQLAVCDEGDLRRVTSELVKTLAILQRDVCRVVRKVAEGVSGMSCKRLKNLEKRFASTKTVLQRYVQCLDQKKLEKTGKNDQACKEKLREDIERMIQDLRIL